MMRRLGIAWGAMLVGVGVVSAQSSPYTVQAPAISLPAPPAPRGPQPKWLSPDQPKAALSDASSADVPAKVLPAAYYPAATWIAPPSATPAVMLPNVASPIAQPPAVQAQITEPASPPMTFDTPAFRIADNLRGPRDNGGLWVSAEAVVAWFRGMELPPLVTTSPAGTPQTAAGVLNQPGTTLLFGGTVDRDVRAGFRVGAGYWFNNDWGVEVGFMMLESQTAIFNATSDGTTILARPFADATTFSSQAVLVAYPGLASGSINARAGSANFYEGHLDAAFRLVEGGGPMRLDALLGYRFYRYDESLGISQTMNPLGALFVPGTQIVASDGFTTTNEFHGFDVGVRPKFVWDVFSIDLLAKVGLGNLHQTVTISGSQVVTVPGAAPVSQVGGVYALPTNIGSYNRNELVVFPELGFGASWQITSNLQIRLGYSALLLNGIASASDQINQTINPNRFPAANQTTGPNQPAFSLRRSDAWIQSISLGLQFTY